MKSESEAFVSGGAARTYSDQDSLVLEVTVGDGELVRERHDEMCKGDSSRGIRRKKNGKEKS